MGVRVRFAPSPTGRLHVGNARIALINRLFATREGGAMILRLDDTDTERSRDEYASGIEADLTWLGLGWDEKYRQSDRLEKYQAAAARLKECDRLYPCYETADELAEGRRRAQARGRPPIYDRAALNQTADDRKRLEDAGRVPHWRFRLEHEPIGWDDLVRGKVQFEGRNLSDPVLVREDASPLYTLTSVVDDLDMAISHVIRGEDHVANTATQIQIIDALGGGTGSAADPIAFAHLPLLVGAGGEALSKRDGALGLNDLREDGIEPMAVNSLLARLGTSDPVQPVADMESLAEGFAWDRFSRASPRFDSAELAQLNARLLHALPHDAVRDRLDALGITAVDETADAAFWNAVRPNLDRLSDAVAWWRVVAGPVEPVVEEASFLADAAALLPPAPWDEATWGSWTGAVKEATGRKGRALFHPLRLALTGRENGPELKLLLPLIGHERATARLSGRTA
jgi:glutamyl-tRNA synthetase